MVPALGVAQTLQNRVGTTFSSLQLLPGPEQSAALVGAGATSIGTAVLTSIKEGQDKILEATNQVVSLIQTQVDIAEEQERRARDNLTELNKERPVQGPPVPIDVGSDKGKFKLDKEGFLGDLDVGDMAAIATAGSLLLSSVAKKVVKGGAKGGFYGILASFLAKPAIDFLEEGVLKIDIPEAQEKKMEELIIAGAVGLGMAGIPGALIGLGAVGVKGIIDYINGEKEKPEFTDFATMAAGLVGLKIISGKAATALTAAGYVKGAGIVAALGATPVLVAIGVGVAAGVAVKYLSDLNEDMQKETLKNMEEMTSIAREELSKRFAEQKESFLEQMGAGGLAELMGFETTDLNKTKISMNQALQEFKEDPSQFDATEQESMMKALDALVTMTPEQMAEILNDQTKTKSMLTILNSARQIAAEGGFGENSKKVMTQLLSFGDKLQVSSAELQAKDQGTYLSDRLAVGEGDLLEQFNKEKSEVKNLENLFNTLDKAYNEMIQQKEDGTYDNLSKDEQKDFRAKFRKISFERQNVEMDLKAAIVDLENLQLFSEGTLGFDIKKLEEMYSEAELKDLINKAITNTLFATIEANIKAKEESESGTGGDQVTNIQSSTKQSSNIHYASEIGNTTSLDDGLHIVVPLPSSGG